MDAGASAMELFRPSDFTILIVDDEPDILDVVAYNLQQEGYRVLQARTGESGLEMARRERPSLIVLDLMLPDLPGVEICRSLRAHPATARIPIVMLTARAGEVDRVSGFESGADDYVTKPFSVRELALRIRARLRSGPQAADEARAESPIRIGKLEVIPQAHRVLVEGAEVHLSLLEFKLLLHLIERRGRVQSRESLLGEVWGYSAEATSRTIDTHVKRLRDKLGPAGDYVETIRGVGYMFAASLADE
ncbi:MAG TPA: response regulator [Polyangia bacterium]|nr:response regulator [Polyangia bacterium]